jgi:hypothetical protein
MDPYIITYITWIGTYNTQLYTHQAKIYIKNIIGCNVYFNKYYKKYENNHDNEEIELKDSVGTVKGIFWKNDRWIIEITIVKVKEYWLFGEKTRTKEKTVYILPDNITRLSSDCTEYKNQVTYRRYPTYAMDLTSSFNRWNYLWRNCGSKHNAYYCHKNPDYKKTLIRIPENPPPCDDFIQSTITQHAPICRYCGNFQEKHMSWPQRRGGNRSRRLINNRKIKSSRMRTLIVK